MSRVAFNTANLVARVSGWKFELKNWGEQDRIIPDAHSRGLPPGASVHLIAAAGHMVHLEQANRVNTVLAAFLSHAETSK